MTQQEADAQHSTTPSVGTAGWQPEVIARDQTAQSTYLDTIAATPILRDTALRAIELLALSPGQAALDVGCGNGVFLPLLAREVGSTGRVVGLDHAAAFVAAAEERAAATGLAGIISVQLGDAYQLPFPDGSFDGVHCERVLQHLEDPDAALSEMARVVRPGGRVVVAEPDWPGWRIDHPDEEALELLYRRWWPMRQPSIGLTLNRRLANVGLTDRQVVLVPGFYPENGVLRTYGLDFHPAAEALVAEGRLTRERAEAALTYLDDASRDETFCAYAVMLVVVGRRPV